eukprot:m51a1_g11035 putative ribosome production factor 1 (320) ;mRNA; f:428291-429513
MTRGGHGLVNIGNVSRIRNKQKRSMVFERLRAEREKARSKERKQRKREEEALGADAPPKKIPRTIDNAREADDTMVDANDPEVHNDVSLDEMASYFKSEAKPKILITTSQHAGKKTFRFARCLAMLFGRGAAKCYRRRTYTLSEISKYAKHKHFTDVIVVCENKELVSDIILSHLPNGPTAYFKVWNVVFLFKTLKILRSLRAPAELIMNNFGTRLGMTIGRMIAALFPQKPDFRAHRVATFHVQRDFIFFRHHRYAFEKPEDEFEQSQCPVATRLQEIGPRFTLKLTALKNDTLENTHSEYIFLPKKQMITSRRRFFL